MTESLAHYIIQILCVILIIFAVAGTACAAKFAVDLIDAILKTYDKVRTLEKIVMRNIVYKADPVVEGKVCEICIAFPNATTPEQADKYVKEHFGEHLKRIPFTPADEGGAPIVLVERIADEMQLGIGSSEEGGGEFGGAD